MVYEVQSDAFIKGVVWKPYMSGCLMKLIRTSCSVAKILQQKANIRLCTYPFVNIGAKFALTCIYTIRWLAMETLQPHVQSSFAKLAFRPI